MNASALPSVTAPIFIFLRDTTRTLRLIKRLFRETTSGTLGDLNNPWRPGGYQESGILGSSRGIYWSDQPEPLSDPKCCPDPDVDVTT